MENQEKCNFTYFSKYENSGNPTIEKKNVDLVETIEYIFEELLINNDKNTVYLLNFDNEIIITENIDLLCVMLYKWETQVICNNIDLQEYGSYETAYEVALMMKEVNPLCYESDPNDN